MGAAPKEGCHVVERSGMWMVVALMEGAALVEVSIVVVSALALGGKTGVQGLHLTTGAP